MLYNLVVIGEAASQIGESTRAAASEIPWPKVIALRNLVAHEYFRVDLAVIQSILAEQLDRLDETARSLLGGDL